MKLSIIIPAFNEEKTVEETVKKVKKQKILGFDKEIILVDDGSSDRTSQILDEIGKKSPSIKVLHHPENRGKGAAVKTGIENATGDYILIQDADLEYDPKYIPSLTTPVLNGEAKVVYGTRLNRMPHLQGEEQSLLFIAHFFGNRMLSLLTSLLLMEIKFVIVITPAKFILIKPTSAKNFSSKISKKELSLLGKRRFGINVFVISSSQVLIW